MCFKCNQRGHKHFECKAIVTKKCQLCGAVGHLEERCLKVWKKHTTSLKNVRCMSCGEFGHLKCANVKLSTGVVKNGFKEFTDSDKIADMVV
jgi:hypothetical protein